MKTLLVTGSRDWTDAEQMGKALRWAFFDLQEYAWTYPKGEVRLIHGNARGADQMADLIWRGNGYGPIERVPVSQAEWETLGKAAGFKRNVKMIDMEPDLCLAFIRNQSKGATMCADLAEKRGILVRRFEVAG